MGTAYDEDIGIPAKLTEWASTTAHITEPAEGKKDLGWINEDVPPSDYQNWLNKNAWRWEKYFNRLFADVITDGLWAQPTVTVVMATMPTFTIGSFVVTTVTGKRLPFAGGTYSPIGLLPETVDAFRMDAVCWRFDESANEWEWAYIEDVYGTGAASLTNEHHIMCFVLIENDAVAYSIYLPDDYGIISPPQISMNKNHIFVRGRYGSTVGENYVGLIGIQVAINVLAARQGGVVEVSGDWHGSFEWEWMPSQLKLKSGVHLTSGSRSLITTPSSPKGQLAAYGMTVSMLGYATGTLDFVSIGGTVRDTTDAAQNFADFGVLSMLKITTGVNAGYYLFKNMSVTPLDPGSQFRTAHLVSMSQEPVVLDITAPPATYTIFLYRARMSGIMFNADNMPIDTDPSVRDLMRIGTTYRCRVERCCFLSNRATADLRSGINCNFGNNYNLEILYNEIIGSFLSGIYTDPTTLEQSLCRVLHNTVNVSGAAAAAADAINFQTFGTPRNEIFGNICTAKGVGVEEQYSTDTGWQGYPATEEHEIDGTHSADIIGASQLKGDSVDRAAIIDAAVDFRKQEQVYANADLDADQTGIAPSGLTTVDFEQSDSNFVTITNGSSFSQKRIPPTRKCPRGSLATSKR